MPQLPLWPTRTKLDSLTPCLRDGQLARTIIERAGR